MRPTERTPARGTRAAHRVCSRWVQAMIGARRRGVYERIAQRKSPPAIYARAANVLRFCGLTRRSAQRAASGAGGGAGSPGVASPGFASPQPPPSARIRFTVATACEPCRWLACNCDTSTVRSLSITFR